MYSRVFITCNSADLQRPLNSDKEDGEEQISGSASRKRGRPERRGSRRKRTLDKAMESTARALAGLGKDSGPSKSFQNMIRAIGEAKTKHVSG